MTYRVAAIQMTSSSHVEKNLIEAEKLIADAVTHGAQLIILPEMFAVMGVDQLDKVKIREEFGRGPIQDFLSQQAAKYKVWLVGGTIPLAVKDSPEKVYAACLLFDDRGEIAAHYDKIHLFDVNIAATKETFLESKTTMPGKQVVVLQTPFGKMGLAVCYDIRFPEMFRAMDDENVELIIVPAAFTYATGRAHWDVLLRARAIENQVYVVASAQTGVHENGRKTYGHSMIIDPWGVVNADLAEGAGVVIAEIDLDYLRKVRGEFPVLQHRRV